MTLRRWLYRHGVRWHAQNLNARPGSTDRRELLGSMWRYGRAWLTLSRGDGETGAGYRELLTINPEWHVGWRGTFALGVSIGGGDSNRDLQVHVDIGFARLFLTVDGLPRELADRILPGYWFERDTYQHFDCSGPDRLKVNHEVEVAVKWHSGGLWWSFWQPTMEWSSQTPKWRSGHFDPADWLLGRHAYSTVDLSTELVEVPMPERTYPATVRIFESTWKRPRWPIARRMVRADIEVEGGIPHPGKGENSWDCDDDATYSLTCAARHPEEAVAKLVESVLRSRRRYGGRNWKPKEAVA